jgi:hypothetical protein
MQKWAYKMATIRARARKFWNRLLIITELGVNLKPLQDSAKTKVYFLIS